MSSVLQILFHLIPVRDSILLNRSPDIIHTMLGSLFYRLLASDKYVSLDADIMPAIVSLAEAEGDQFTPMDMDDPTAFLNWLNLYHLGWILEPLFGTTSQKILSYNGVVLSRTKLNDIINIASILDAPGVPVHEYLFDHEMKASVSFTVRYSEQPQDVQKQLRTLGLRDEQKVLADEALQCTFTPPILVIAACKFDYTVAGNDKWRYEVPTVYQRTFDLHQKRYRLYGAVIHHPLHYTAYVCTDPAQDIWHVLNDGVVTQVDGDFDIGKDGYIFFYVEETLFESWKTGTGHKVPDYTRVPTEYQQLGQVLEALHTVKVSVAKYTNSEITPCKINLIPSTMEARYEVTRIAAGDVY